MLTKKKVFVWGWKQQTLSESDGSWTGSHELQSEPSEIKFQTDSSPSRHNVVCCATIMSEAFRKIFRGEQQQQHIKVLIARQGNRFVRSLVQAYSTENDARSNR